MPTTLVTIAQYRAIISDHPKKFNETEAGYVPATRNNTDYFCVDCLHFYRGPVARRTTCEILRRTLGQDIEPKAHCAFWTHTGDRFPLLRNGNGA
jgi:hypothetical protein